MIAGIAGFLGGISLASFLGTASATWVVLLGLCGALIFMRTIRPIVLCAIASMVLLGVGRYSWAEQPTLLEQYVGQERVLDGFVESDFRKTETGGRMYVRVVMQGDLPIGERVLVETSRWPMYRFGQRVRLEGDLSAPRTGGSFDYRSYLKKEGVRVIMEQPHISEREGTARRSPLGSVWTGVRASLYSVRDSVASGIRRAVPEPGSAYLNGIILGMREDLPQSVLDDFANTGTTHVLAISGYNVSIVAELFMLVCVMFIPRRKAALVAIIAIAGFVLLTGASASVVRAGIMGSILLFARSFGRSLQPLVLLLLTAALMSAFNPYILRYDVGFQLSFVAVAGLIYLAPIFDTWISVPKKLVGARALLTATVAATIATLPLILYTFGTLAVYALPANMAILPVIPYAMVAGAVAGAVGMVLPAASVLVGIPAWALAWWQLHVVSWFADLPLARMTITIPMVGLVAGYALLVAFVFWHGHHRKNHSPA